MDGLKRCNWCTKSEIERHYHDKEWGVPLHDDLKLFEFVILDGFQAGLSWKIVLTKRAHFKEAFFDYNPEVLSTLGSNQVDIWMQNKGLIRNRLKLQAVIKNATAFLKVQKEYGSFARYIWSFVNHQTIDNRYQTHTGIASVSPEAEAMSKSMKKHGFTFCGPTICYAFMQAAGLVNDHLTSCFRYAEIKDRN